MAELELVLPGGARKQLTLTGIIVLGRVGTCPVNLSFPGVSRTHVEIKPVGDGWELRDLESRNGTFVNGVRVETTRLADGDEILFGPVRGTFRTRAIRDPSIVDSAPSVILSRFPPAAFVSPEQLARDYDLLRCAHALSQAIGEVRDEELVLRRVLRFCVDQLDTDHAVVVEQTADGGVTVRASLARHEATTRSALPLSTTILGLLAETGQALLISDAASELASAKSVMALGIASLAAVPLTMAGRFFGALVLDNRARQSAFSKRDLHVLTGVAAQASLALERSRLLARVEADGETRGRLSRFLSPEIVEQVVRGELELEPGGHDGTVAVLFCDIRGFTPLSRELGAVRTMEMLNEYFETLVPIVAAHGGMVDKYAGDELMAVWGVPHPRPDDAQRAVACGLAVQRALVTLSEQRLQRGEPVYACGVGVNAGPAQVGLLGSASRVQYTVIGDAVNIGSRLCGKALAGEVLTLPHLLEGWSGEAFDPPVATDVKGWAERLPVCRARPT